VVGNGPASDEYGAYCSGPTNTRLVQAAISQTRFGLALWGATGLQIDGYVGHGCRTPLYGVGLVNAELNWLDLQSIGSDPLDHPLYLEGSCSGLTGHDWILQGNSAGYTLHLYTESGPSEGLDVQDIVMAGYHGVIIHEWSGIHLKNLQSTVSTEHFRLWNCADILIEDFECWGGNALVRHISGYTHSNVIFRNGIYHGPQLVYGGGSIPGVTIEDSVELAA
jgi:hypothetical protein